MEFYDLSEASTAADIEKAFPDRAALKKKYRKLCLLHHPDKAKVKAEQQMANEDFAWFVFHVSRAVTLTGNSASWRLSGFFLVL